MKVIQDSVGDDLDHCYGTCHGEIATYDPGYEECGETACHTPGQGFDHTAEMAVIQLWQYHPGSACVLHTQHSTSVCHVPW